MTNLSFFLGLVFIHATLIGAAWLPRTDHLRRQNVPSVPVGVPPQCQNVCGPPQTTISTCNPPTPSCLCTKTFQTSLFNCFTCLGQSINATNYATPQSEVDEVTTACDQAGNPLPELTFPGQNPNRSLATSATTRAATATTGTPTQSGGPSSGSLSITQSIQSIPSAPTSITSISTTIASTGGGSASTGSTSATPSTTPANSASGSIGVGVGAWGSTYAMWVTVVGVLLAMIAT